MAIFFNGWRGSSLLPAERSPGTRGIANANKIMLMAATAYNLKKYLKFTQKKMKSMAETAETATASIFRDLW